MDQRVYQIALGLLSGIGPKKAKLLVSQLGNAELVFKESEKALNKIEGFGTHFVKQLNRSSALELAQLELDYIERNQIKTYYYKDPEYPSKLVHCDDGPIVLFGKGKLDFNFRNIAVVGTRKATPYGKKMVQELIEGLKEYDVQIVSGLAFGIDIEAHKSALKEEVPTIAVLGTGFENMHPAGHKVIAKEMLRNGGVLTEYLGNSKVDSSNFPKRNRIVAGMCDATIVVESASSGGSMITANLAMDYNRDVFAYPGNVDKHSSTGCNRLIRENKAMLLTGAEDLIEVLGWENKNAFGSVQTNLFVELNEFEDKISTVLREKGEMDVNHLSYETEMTSSNMALHLFNLELKGVIQSLPGKRYKVI